jgi:transposase
VRLQSNSKVRRESRTFETTTAGLEALLAWLSEMGCTHVAMEATGVYWKPVWNILSAGDFELILANASHIKNVPGRKTDMKDAEWIADLLACGLIRASFVPDQVIQDLRSLMRTRKQFVREQTRHVQRIQKTLEEGNIKLDAVISDILGANGRRMIEAMIAGESNPQQLAALADRRLKASPTELRDALHGRLTETHRFLLRTHLKQWDELDATIAEIDRQVDVSGIDPAVVHDPRCRQAGCDHHPGGNRPRHEPVPHGGPSGCLVGLVSGPEPERRQTQVLAIAQGGAVAQDHAGAMCLGGQAAEEQLL